MLQLLRQISILFWIAIVIASHFPLIFSISSRNLGSHVYWSLSARSRWQISNYHSLTSFIVSSHLFIVIIFHVTNLIIANIIIFIAITVTMDNLSLSNVNKTARIMSSISIDSYLTWKKRKRKQHKLFESSNSNKGKNFHFIFNLLLKK